jgi:putative IMPACT (imprinted ancient) family translation regulator
MIVRYFGGTKLGTGGLVKAYGDSVKELLKLVKTEELVKKSSFILNTSYDRYEGNKLLLQRYDCNIDNEEFAMDVCVSGTIRSSKVEEMEKEIIEKSAARDEILFEDIPL